MTLFPHKKLLEAGSQIQQLLQQADQDPQKRSHITDLLEKHFGSSASPNPELIPNVPAAEKTGIVKLLQHEIVTQGRSDGLGGSTFSDLQSFKRGAEMRAGYDKSISTGKQEMYRKMAKAYGNVIKEAIPEIKKPYQEYGEAANTLKEHGAGISGFLHKMMYGGGLAGWALRNATIYPAIRGIMHLLTNDPRQTMAKQGSYIGFRGGVS